MRPDVLIVAIAMGTALACQYPPRGDLSRLDEATTRTDLVLFVGEAPESCVPSGAGAELCTWHRLGNQNDAWWTLAAIASTTERVNLVCELPTDGSARGADSCSIHPCEAAAFAPDATWAERQTEARAELSSALDVAALSRIVGSGPLHCQPSDDLTDLCVWSVTTASEGWEIISVAFDVDGRLRLLCALPGSGEARGEGSCTVSGSGVRAAAPRLSSL